MDVVIIVKNDYLNKYPKPKYKIVQLWTHVFKTALYGDSQATVNYITETNSLENGMINTKSSSAKVIKGEPLD